MKTAYNLVSVGFLIAAASVIGIAHGPIAVLGFFGIVLVVGAVAAAAVFSKR